MHVLPPAHDRIHHYTTGEGLLGILKEASIRCTHLHYLNDSLEYRIGDQLYENVLNKLINFSHADLEYAHKIRELAATAQSRMPWSQDTAPASRRNVDVFVSSFTKTLDCLSQWRGYSNSGPKFCLSFDINQLQQLAEEQDLLFGPVRYKNEDEEKKLTDVFCQKAMELWDRLNGGTHVNTPMNWHPPEFFQLNKEVRSVVDAFVKHYSFEEEQEYRLVSKKTNNQKYFEEGRFCFRPGRSFLIPYISVQMSNLNFPLVAITVGPSPHMEEAIASVRMLVAQHRQLETNQGREFIAPGVEINKSDIPFRDWH